MKGYELVPDSRLHGAKSSWSPFFTNHRAWVFPSSRRNDFHSRYPCPGQNSVRVGFSPLLDVISIQSISIGWSCLGK
jgi:hypothetical protein